MFLYFPWKFQNSRVLNCKLNNDIYLLNLIRDWVIKQEPSINTPSHWWFKDLPPNIYNLFYDISKITKIIEMFKKSFGKQCIIDILDDMNEIYVSPSLNNNDNLQKIASNNKKLKMDFETTEQVTKKIGKKEKYFFMESNTS